MQGIPKSLGQTVVLLGEIALGEFWEEARKEGWSLCYQAEEFELHVL